MPPRIAVNASPPLIRRSADAAKIMREIGPNPPAADFGKKTILGQVFESSKPGEYLKSVRKPS